MFSTCKFTGVCGWLNYVNKAICTSPRPGHQVHSGSLLLYMHCTFYCVAQKETYCISLGGATISRSYCYEINYLACKINAYYIQISYISYCHHFPKIRRSLKYTPNPVPPQSLIQKQSIDSEVLWVSCRGCRLCSDFVFRQVFPGQGKAHRYQGLSWHNSDPSSIRTVIQLLALMQTVCNTIEKSNNTGINTSSKGLLNMVKS